MDAKAEQSDTFSRQPLFRMLLSFFRSARQKYALHKELLRLADQRAEKIDPSIKQIHGYRNRLLSPLLQCQTHCKNIVGQIPGPIPIHIPHSSPHPLIEAAFNDQQQMDALISRAEAQQGSLDGESLTKVALLTMMHRESDFFGISRQGQMVMADARMKAVTFSDHKIVGIAPTLEESRHRLEHIIFEVMIESVAHELADRKSDLGDLRVQREKLQAMLKLFGDPAYDSGSESAREEKLDKVKLLLKETESSLSAARIIAETPEDRLNFLVGYLKKPERVMDIRLVSLRLDWSNVITNDTDVAANTIQFAQCAIHEKVKRDAVLITYSLPKGSTH